MSDAEENKDKQSNGKEVGPTRSFAGLVKGTGGRIGPFG